MYGLTSQLHALVAVAVAAAAPGYFVVATKVLLAFCLAVAAWLVAGLAERLSGRYDVAVGVTLLSVGCPLAAWTLHTGMETALAFLVTTVASCAILAPSPARTHARTAAIATALVYLCRPDVALLPALTFLGANLRDRRRVVLYLLWLAVLLGAFLLAFRLYYGTALPLPFYAKTRGLGPYDAALRELGVHDKLVHLATFLAFSAPLLWLSRPLADARSAALVVASVAFVAYHAFVTSEIMGYRARFYAPALIPLALAAALGARRRLESPRGHRALFLGAWILAIALCHHFGFVASASAGLERVAWTAFAVQVAIAGWLALADDSAADDRSVGTGAFVLFLLGAVAALPPRWGGLLRDRDFLEKVERGGDDDAWALRRGALPTERLDGLPLRKSAFPVSSFHARASLISPVSCRARSRSIDPASTLTARATGPKWCSCRTETTWNRIARSPRARAFATTRASSVVRRAPSTCETISPTPSPAARVTPSAFVDVLVRRTRALFEATPSRALSRQAGAHVEKSQAIVVTCGDEQTRAVRREAHVVHPEPVLVPRRDVRQRSVGGGDVE